MRAAAIVAREKRILKKENGLNAVQACFLSRQTRTGLGVFLVSMSFCLELDEQASVRLLFYEKLRIIRNSGDSN